MPGGVRPTRPATQYMTSPVITFRHEVVRSDLDAVKDIVLSTGRFNEDEVLIAAELVQDRLDKGPHSEYTFLFAMNGESVLGYTCFGHIRGTRQRYEVYWIAVHAAFQRLGVGRALLVDTERAIREQGGQRLYIETCSREEYQATRTFYTSLGYQKAAQLDGYYTDGDGLVVFMKQLAFSPEGVAQATSLSLAGAVVQFTRVS
jgi:ribosomal protein S18 acetylase RimI-like enzyme